MSMQQPERLLGNGFRASPISFGAMGMSEFYGVPPVEEDSLAVLERSLELGVTMIDTADMYGRGHNEALIGRLLAKHRQEVGAGQIKIATLLIAASAYISSAAGLFDHYPAGHRWQDMACTGMARTRGGTGVLHPRKPCGAATGA